MDIVLGQGQVLTPQLIQSLKLLQLGSQELSEYIAASAEENPVLEAAPVHMLEVPYIPPAEPREMRDAWASGHSHTDGAGKPLSQIVADRFSQGAESLPDHLSTQLSERRLGREQEQICRYIIHCLDPGGYLEETDSELAELIGCTRQAASAALEIVRSLDPAGVGARSLSDCLCLQLERMGMGGLAHEIAEKHLGKLGAGRYNLLSELTGRSEKEVRRAAALLRSLEPRPGSPFSHGEETLYIIPEITVAVTQSAVTAALNDSLFPSLSINPYYSALRNSTDDPEVRRYLSSKIDSARSLIYGLGRRRATMLRCAEALVSLQEEFFRLGPGNVRPMSLSDIGAAVDVHESTVSRALKDKYLLCAYGVFPLSHFLSRPLGGDGINAPSADRAKSLLAGLVGGEDKTRPLSDQKLCILLGGYGVFISRRTVAKYRAELGIPSSPARKRA